MFYKHAVRVSVSAARIDAVPALGNIVRPQALEPGDDFHALILIQRFRESRHDAAKRGTAICDRVIKHFERMVPGMRSTVERRRRIVSGRIRSPPLDSSAAVGRMAACAVNLIKRFAGYNLGRGIPSTGHRFLIRRISGTG